LDEFQKEMHQKVINADEQMKKEQYEYKV